jgi:hypothetical protein
MLHIRWTTWRRDLLVGVLASLLTVAVLVPLGLAAVRGERLQAEASDRLVRPTELLREQSAAEADRQRTLAQKNLVEQAADFIGMNDRSEAEVFRVTTDAVAPEIPVGAHVLIVKKATAFGVGDIVVCRIDGKNYLGRVVAVDRPGGKLTMGRNGEENCTVPITDVIGRGVLNTR